MYMYMRTCTAGLLKSNLHVHTILSISLNRFLFKQGVYESADNCSVPGGFWTIDLEIDNERYKRYSHDLLFSKFEVPTGTSYACGNNSHNMFVYDTAKNDTAHTYPAYKFSSMQVCNHSQYVCILAMYIYRTS